MTGRTRLTLTDDAGSFEVTLLDPAAESAPDMPVVLFAVGAGGDPERHLPLLSYLAESGFTVVAPHFQRLPSPNPTEDDFLLRTRRLRLSLTAQPYLAAVPVLGIGHSIGAASLLGLAGGGLWLGPEQRVIITPEKRLGRLVLLTPPTRFFSVPGALDRVQTPILAWAGSLDHLTPPEQLQVLENARRDDLPIETRVTDGAGHFSFMDTPPPLSEEPLADREQFLEQLRREIRQFLNR